MRPLSAEVPGLIQGTARDKLGFLRGRSVGSLTVQCVDHGDAPLMPASGEPRVKKCLNNLRGQSVTKQSASKGQHICVVMFARVSSGRDVMAQSGPNSENFIADHGAPYPRPVYHNAEFDFTCGYQFGYPGGIDGIIDRFGAVAADVLHVAPELCQEILEELLHLIAAMIRADRDSGGGVGISSPGVSLVYSHPQLCGEIAGGGSNDEP